MGDVGLNGIDVGRLASARRGIRTEPVADVDGQDQASFGGLGPAQGLQRGADPPGEQGHGGDGQQGVQVQRGEQQVRGGGEPADPAGGTTGSRVRTALRP
ncbi:hypothetical protein ACFY94_34465 [Streptomyces griseorubiginosus]|uniref:hypothetical protein n=1 Tax=Streptomyces TaxID=1883 RepID=UPI001414F62E